jgi:hypothetical protein
MAEGKKEMTKDELRAKLETGLVLRQIDLHNGKTTAVPVCNLCGELITDRKMANFEWFYEKGREDICSGPLFALHKHPCSEKVRHVARTFWRPAGSFLKRDQHKIAA